MRWRVRVTFVCVLAITAAATIPAVVRARTKRRGQAARASTTKEEINVAH